MSKQVDERVVSMQFDNKQFERNVSTTMSTLEKFKKALKLDGAVKGLQEVDSAAKKVDMSQLGNGIETVRSKFSALQVMGVTALANITNSAVTAGKRMVSALTIDPIKTGFQEYETQLNAVQTILANTQSKGTTLTQVNAALDELNTYADKTIYNFTEMTRNIGTFTAAGVDLETSVNAIQGIANLAAVSGSNSQQASTAMYQLSQALASGTVKLMDWNSVVNAGMGGQVFQDALKETSKQLGTGAEAAIKANGSFRESLQTGWLTSEVLTETLKKFTTSGANEYIAEYTGLSAQAVSEALKSAEAQYGEAEAIDKAAEALATKSGKNKDEIKSALEMARTAEDAATKVKTFTQLIDTLKESLQSGWTQTWETIIGDFEEAKELWTSVSDALGGIINETSEARNEMLSGAFDSGWDQLLKQGIADEEGYKEAIQNVAKENNVNFEKMIDDAGSFEEALKKGLGEGTITSDMLSKSVTTLADKIRGMSEEERENAGYTYEQLESLEALEKGLKDGTISMEDFTKKMLRPSGRELLIDSVKNAFDGLVSIVTPIKQAFSEIFKPLTSDQLYGFLEGLKELTAKFTISEKTSSDLKSTCKGLFALLNIGIKAVKALFDGFSKLVGYIAPAGGGILSFTASIGDFIVGIDTALESSDAFGKVIEGIGKVLAPIGKVIKTFVTTALGSFKDLSEGTKVRFDPLTTIFTALGKALQAVAPIFAAVASKIGEALNGIREAIGSAVGNADYSKFFDLLNGGIFAAIGVGIAKFTNSLGNAGKSISGFMDGLKDILGGASEALNAFTGSIKAKTLKTIASAIAILAVALWAIALIDSNKLMTSLGAIAALFIDLMAAMSVFTKIADGKSIKNMYVIGRAMKSLATAVLILAVAMKILSGMTWEEMGIGLISITVGLGLLVGAVNLLPDKQVGDAAKAIKKMSTAMLILAVAIKLLSTMSWEEMGIGLISMVVGLGAMVGAVNLLPKDAATKAGQLVLMATAMVILGAALKIMGSMSWKEMGIGLISMAVGLGVMVGALHLMPENLGFKALGMVVMATAMVILGAALKNMSSMSWEELGRGLVALAGSLLILSGAMALMKSGFAGAAAMMVMSLALAVLTPILKTLGNMSWEQIAKGLIAIAGAFVIIGVAGYVLGPMVGTICALSGAIALFGVACLAVGIGVAAFSAGLLMLSTAGAGAAVAITAIISSIIGLIPYIIEQIGVGIIKLCEVIAGSSYAICAAITVIILAVVEAIVTSAPAIVDGILVLLDKLLTSLVTYVPKVVDLLFDLLIGIINKLAERMPDLIQAGVNLIMALFQGVIDALKSVDPNSLVNGIMAVGVMTALMAALAACAVLAPAAMIGVLAVGAVAAELAIVLAAVGALAQIPGLEWLISEGGDFMQKIGKAIGQFLGGIVGGFAQGVSSALPQIGSDLSAFMLNAMPFIAGAKMIDSSTLDGVKSLVGVILALTGANIIESLTSFITGGSSLSKFGEEISAFAPYLKEYSDTVKDIDPVTVTASANAAKCLSELADNLPNSGGLAGWFAGENDIGMFGEQLPAFGKGLKAFSDSVEGIVPENIVAATKAAQSIVDLSQNIPNEGGVAAWFAGDNSISSFGSQLPILGAGLLLFSQSVNGLSPENIQAAVQAAQAIVDMSQTIPNEGGMVSWFTGDNSIAKFASQLPALGTGLSTFSNSVAGIVPENIIAAAQAANAIAVMSQHIPNEGGMVSWFTGDNSIANFASQLPILGAGLLEFSMSVMGIVPDNVIAASNAAKSLAEMSQIIPNEGGMVAWFTGDNSIASFASQLPILGNGLLGFSNTVTGIIPENIIGAANAAKILAEMTNIIPNEGGMKAWFSGDSGVVVWANSLPTLGAGLLAFSVSTIGIIPENIIAASNAAKALVEMTKTIPNEGGMKAWFSGDSGLVQFANNLPTLGDGLASFATSVSGITNLEGVATATSAAKSLAEITKIVPTEGGMKAWFSGDSGVAKFADNLPTLGEGLKGFADKVDGINAESVTPAANAAKTLAEMTKTTPKNTDNLIDFGDNLVTFGGKLKSYFDKTAKITTDSITASSSAIKSVTDVTSKLKPSTIKSASEAIDNLVKTLTKCSKIKENTVSGFKKAVTNLGKVNAEALLKAFKDANPTIEKAGKEMMEQFIKGLEAKKKSIKEKSTSLATSAADAAKEKKSSFESAGKAMADGFANGIKLNTYKAEAKAKAMAKAAYDAAKKQLNINSPSKVFMKLAYSIPEGIAMGIDKMSYLAEDSSIAMARQTINGTKEAISRVVDVINSDMDTEPTIRPVLDLSDVKAGASSIDGMFSARTLSINTDSIGRISAGMANYQNGKGNGDVVSAIKALRKDISNIPGNSTVINGVTYDDGSNVSNAVGELVRAMQIERRV